MAEQQMQPFRFLDLPREIRNKIYRELLCRFCYPTEGGILDRHAKRIYKIQQRNGTAILRTSHQVHREAFDVMVKTNHFINIECRDFPLAQFLTASQVPILATTSELVNRFRGYLLKLFIYPKDTEWDISFSDNPRADEFLYGSGPARSRDENNHSLMILGADFYDFCGLFPDMGLFVPGYKEIDFKVTVWLNAFPKTLPAWKTPITEYFTDKTQRALLTPLGLRVKEVPHVEIGGSVERSLAENVERAMKTMKLADPEAFLNFLRETKLRGMQFYRQEQYAEAEEEWRRINRGVLQLQMTRSWDVLVKHGDKDTAAGIVEIQFTTMLNLAQICVTYMKDPARLRFQGERMARSVSSLHKGAYCFLEDYSRMGGTWRPTSAQDARFEYRKALSMRLLGDSEFFNEAIACIECAVESSPHDQIILQEKQNILRWREEHLASLDDNPPAREMHPSLQSLLEGFAAAMRS